jgi:hypothetical protein
MIVKLHEGRIGVKSEGEGKGSTFFIDIPIHSFDNYDMNMNNGDRSSGANGQVSVFPYLFIFTTIIVSVVMCNYIVFNYVRSARTRRATETTAAVSCISEGLSSTHC